MQQSIYFLTWLATWFAVKECIWFAGHAMTVIDAEAQRQEAKVGRWPS